VTPAAFEIVVLQLVPLLVAAVARVVHPPRDRRLALVRLPDSASGRRATGR
jgi:hypothetical protein